MNFFEVKEYYHLITRWIQNRYINVISMTFDYDNNNDTIFISRKSINFAISPTYR